MIRPIGWDIRGRIKRRYHASMSRRDVVLGLLFLVGMGVFGALVLWAGRAKWQAEMQREEQRYRVLEAQRRLAAARQDIENGRAREAAENATWAIDNGGEWVDAYAVRARARAMSGDREAAQRDLARAKELEPNRDWSELDKLLGPP